MAQARLHERSLRNPLAAPLLVTVGLAPFVVEVVLASDVPTVPAVWGAAMVVIATANFALGLPRLGAAVALLALDGAVGMLDAGLPELGGLNAVSAGLLVLSGGLLVWSVRSGEYESLRELVDEAHEARSGER